MTWDKLRLCVRAVLWGSRADAELQEEMAAHLEAQTRKYMEQSMSAEEARRRACVDFGALEGAKEECRDARGLPGSSTWRKIFALRFAWFGGRLDSRA